MIGGDNENWYVQMVTLCVLGTKTEAPLGRYLYCPEYREQDYAPATQFTRLLSCFKITSSYTIVPVHVMYSTVVIR